ncbi:AraC family transcriptional regulator [Chryseolinea sp. T2]|uniref:helix-turn-helix domain-containing protein n=1 Tax=Chryseolinea sp. T2 TaxID=3129255 RepID=UPI003076F678
MSKKTTSKSIEKNLPVFELHAFSEKATWSEFYIENVRDHVKEHAFVEKPHKHDFYLILFVEKGRGTHTIDFVQYPIEAGSIFLMTPGQVHSWTMSPDTRGWVIFFTREFYEMHLSQNSLLEFPFYHSLVPTPVVRPGKGDAFKFAVRQLYDQYKASSKPNTRILRAYLEIFLLEAARYYNDSRQTTTHTLSFKIRKLEQLIEENFLTLKQPSDYGELMNLAPAYLNSICKDALGRTLSDLIQGRLALEAKRMFAYSDKNVNEVAEALNFKDASYFVRWFKKQNGSTPEEFRKTI